jgi:very-short-patch-repair endonuclease
VWWLEKLRIAGFDEFLYEQGGIVSRTQLLAAGRTDVLVRQRIRSRRWQTVFPGVYATYTGNVDYHGRILAGLLYAGADARWSHYTAAEQQGLIAVRTDRPVYVTVPRRVRPQPGLVITRSTARENRTSSAVPPRTTRAHAVLEVVDIAESLDDAVAVVAEACQSGNVSAAQLARALRSRRGLTYRHQLGPVLEDVAAGTHSVLEVRYLQDIERRHGLPTGTRQRAVGAEFTDVAYERHGVVVELDGRLHLEPTQRWRDMDRDNRATLRTERSLRYGWTDVVSRPCQVAVQVLAALRMSGQAVAAHACGSACPVQGEPP